MGEERQKWKEQHVEGSELGVLQDAVAVVVRLKGDHQQSEGQRWRDHEKVKPRQRSWHAALTIQPNHRTGEGEQGHGEQDVDGQHRRWKHR